MPYLMLEWVFKRKTRIIQRRNYRTIQDADLPCDKNIYITRKGDPESSLLQELEPGTLRKKIRHSARGRIQRRYRDRGYDVTYVIGALQ